MRSAKSFLTLSVGGVGGGGGCGCVFGERRGGSRCGLSYEDTVGPTQPRKDLNRLQQAQLTTPSKQATYLLTVELVDVENSQISIAQESDRVGEDGLRIIE